MFLPLLPLQPFSCQSAAACPASRREHCATEQLRGRGTHRGTEQSGVFVFKGTTGQAARECWTQICASMDYQQ